MKFWFDWEGAVAQLVERVTPDEEVVGLILALAALFLLLGLVPV